MDARVEDFGKVAGARKIKSMPELERKKALLAVHSDNALGVLL